MDVLVKVWGPYACFTRPEFSTERKSYEIITPSAARNILQAIYWHPGVQYTIKTIWVRKPIRFTNIRQNEVSDVALAGKILRTASSGEGDLYLATSSCIQQRMSTILRDVEYYILAHVSLDNDAVKRGYTMGKVSALLTRRLENGGCFNQPYFGLREFPAYFEQCSIADIPPCPTSLKGEKDLGVMLYDMNYTDKKNIYPQFYHPIMVDGCVEVKVS